MDSTMYNYDPNANTAGACVPFIYGCTDPTSFNYNPNAIQMMVVVYLLYMVVQM